MQIREARNSTAKSDAKKRIDQEIKSMDFAIQQNRSALPRLEKGFQIERLRAIENLAPDLRNAFQEYNDGFEILTKEGLCSELNSLASQLQNLGSGTKPKNRKYWCEQQLSNKTHNMFNIPLYSGVHDHRPIRTSPNYLVGLMRECADILPRFHEAVEAIVDRVNKAYGSNKVLTIKYAPLKGRLRCHAKAMEKYKRRYDLIQDIARLTIVVHPASNEHGTLIMYLHGQILEPSLTIFLYYFIFHAGNSQMKPLLDLMREFIRATKESSQCVSSVQRSISRRRSMKSLHPSDSSNQFVGDEAVPRLRIVRVKNRMDPAHESIAAGGYRDILLNCKLQDSDITCEIQINMESLIKIKDSVGHKSYKMARRLHAFGESTTSYTGSFSKEAVELVRRGVLTKLVSPGSQAPSDVTEFGMATSFMRQMCIKLV